MAASAVANGLFFLLGNNRNEFWFYYSGSGGTFARPSRPAIAGGTVLGLKPLSGLYPNPAKGSVLVRYTLPSPGPATLRVYDVLGRVVRSERSAFGDFAIDGLSAGIYLVQVEAIGYKGRQRLVVVK